MGRIPVGFNNRRSRWKAEEIQKFLFPVAECILGDLLSPSKFHLLQLLSRITEMVFNFRSGRKVYKCGQSWVYRIIFRGLKVSVVKFFFMFGSAKLFFFVFMFPVIFFLSFAWGRRGEGQWIVVLKWCTLKGISFTNIHTCESTPPLQPVERTTACTASTAPFKVHF